MAFFVGVLLSTITQKNRQDFEMELQRSSDRYKMLKKEK